MAFAYYILIELSPGTAKTAAGEISKIEGLRMANAVTQPFDVIAFAEVSNLASLSELVLSRIQSFEGVKRTQTAVVVTSERIRTRASAEPSAQECLEEKLPRRCRNPVLRRVMLYRICLCPQACLHLEEVENNADVLELVF